MFVDFSVVETTPFLCEKKCLGETGVFSIIISLILWEKQRKCVCCGGGTLADSVDERMFLLSGLGFQKFVTRFSGLG